MVSSRCASMTAAIQMAPTGSTSFRGPTHNSRARVDSGDRGRHVALGGTGSCESTRARTDANSASRTSSCWRRLEAAASTSTSPATQSPAAGAPPTTPSSWPTGRQNFFGWNAANFGWGGDTTQNILWRLTQRRTGQCEPEGHRRDGRHQQHRQRSRRDGEAAGGRHHTRDKGNRRDRCGRRHRRPRSS